jgi:hypothetical protein
MGRIRMKRNIKAIFFLTVFLVGIYLLSSCSTKKSFYQQGSDLDYLRFPVLDPYYAIKIDDEYGWEIPLHIKQAKRNFWDYLAILNVKKVAVDEDTILVFSEYSDPIEIIPGKQKKELHWFLLIPNQEELGFETEDEFINSLQQYGIDTPEWYEPNSLLEEFGQTGCLVWFPNCSKPTQVK